MHGLPRVSTLKTRLYETTVGMADKMEISIDKLNASSWNSLRVNFIVEGFEIAQET